MKTRRIICTVGAVIFAVAFFVPAVGEAGKAPGSSAVPGWVCAWITAVYGYTVPIQAIYGHAKLDSGEWLLVLSGWTSPFVAIYLLLYWWRKMVIVRLVLAVVILAGLVSAWLFFLTQPASHSGLRQVPLLGHYLWTAGILLILISEFRIAALRRETAELPPNDDLRQAFVDSLSSSAPPECAAPSVAARSPMSAHRPSGQLPSRSSGT